MSGDELPLVQEAFASNWIAPVGPHVDAFEKEFCAAVGAKHAAALSCGTAAIHLALKLAGVKPGDEVLCSTLTFAGSANPIIYEGGRPVFVDSDRASWNMDPGLLSADLDACARRGRVPRAVVLVHLYGQSADIEPILAACRRHDVALIEDAAECLGATYKGRAPGTFGAAGAFSFNGNKIITTSNGGMLVSDDGALIEKARFLATQARDPAPHYQHSHVGYNYRLSNVLAGIGRGQLRVLAPRVQQRRRNFDFYRAALKDLPGITFMPEASYGTATRWLSVILVDPREFGATREDVRLRLEAENIEARPVWKPMHLQPVFAECRRVGGSVAEALFDRGLCLPSGSQMTEGDLARVAEIVRAACH
ncbi:MAG: DegT/DnrJ/EryC1/StrS family aminotransferase [Planctomycetes bacterium]|nr:DegT/DnrJ/EryC1/StrS family aminotransferase [Planctomycetota bacterium]